MENFNFLNEIDSLIKEVDEATKVDFDAIDSICAEIHATVEQKDLEITSMSDDQKRKLAVTTDDPYILNLLSQDMNFNIRILTLCNPNISINLLRRALEDGYPYIYLVVANNPVTTKNLLNRITQLSDNKEVIDAVYKHPNVSEETKKMIENNRGN